MIRWYSHHMGDLGSLLLTIMMLTVSLSVKGHAPDQSYLYLRIYEKQVEGTVEMTYKDINTAMNLELKRGMGIDDIQPFLPQIRSYIRNRVQLSANGKVYQFDFIEPELFEADMGVFLRSHFRLPGMKTIPEEIDIDYNIMFDVDDDHQGMAIIAHHWKSGIVNNEAIPSLLFSSSNRSDKLSLSEASLWKGFYNMLKLGVWHIWIGLDHILFLLALLLPAVVRREENEMGEREWVAVRDFRSAFWYIIKVVTWFTIAHSITLSLAALGFVQISSRIVESIIALSIALAAFHNIKPVFGHREWLIALGFGLFHGLGFASVLGEKGLNGEYMTLSLLGFNVGVEVGQIFIICLIFPFLFILRKHDIYKSIIYYGSILLILISFYWFFERFFEIDLPVDDFIAKVINKITG